MRTIIVSSVVVTAAFTLGVGIPFILLVPKYVKSLAKLRKNEEQKERDQIEKEFPEVAQAPLEDMARPCCGTRRSRFGRL